MISVITPTYNRRELLLDRCVPSVQAQTHTDLEHIVVDDGSDEQLEDALAGVDRVRYVELRRHLGGLGELQRLEGLEEAKGELIAYLDDDNAYRPEHLEQLAMVLQANRADFAYSRMQRHWPSGWTDEVGTQPPTYGQIDTSLLLHRRELLQVATWRTGYAIPGAPDWDLAQRWLQAGASWVHLPVITVDYWARG
jgi:glycosyltransferase involved in cell wall biosynthesis